MATFPLFATVKMVVEAEFITLRAVPFGEEDAQIVNLAKREAGVDVGVEVPIETFPEAAEA